MKKIIFLADDSITIQKVVELTFSEGNYEVVCVGNGAAAMQRLAQASPDIALLDVIMPERNGYDICSYIKKDKDMSWTPVLLLTGAFEPYDDRRASDAGADGHMTKPFESRALVSAVEALLASHPRPGQAAEKAAAQATPPSQAAAQPPAAAQTLRMKASDLFAQPSPGMAGPPAAAPSRAPASNGGTPTVSVPPEVIDRAVREAVAGVSEKIVREVAWEVIPDLAEAIIRRRIRELEDETER